MDGVTVLSEVVEASIGPFSLFTFILAGITCIFLLILMIMHCSTSKDFAKYIVVLVCAILFILVIGICNDSLCKEEKYYEVLVDDSVTMNEFFKYYELEKIEGKIYTVKEKEG